MKIHSVGLEADLFFLKESTIKETESYYLVVTENNPGYYWGNFIIYKNKESLMNVTDCEEDFKKEFSYLKNVRHMAFTVDVKDGMADFGKFIKKGYEKEFCDVLVVDREIEKPKYYDSNLNIRIIEGKEGWKGVLELQLIVNNDFSNDYREFMEKKYRIYEKMSKNGLGNWYGAYIDGKLVGDMGLFFKGKIGRFQSVETHPDYRGKGICQTMVYEVAQKAFRNNVDALVMVADKGGYAGRLYRKLGFLHKQNHNGVYRSID